MIIDRFRLDGRVGFVTGAARGIGNAIACALCEAGARVVLSDADAAACEQAAQELCAKGHVASSVPLDVCDPDAAAAVALGVVETFGQVDILVNNAGVASLAPSLELSDAEWRRIIEVNTNAVFWVSKAFGRHMVERGEGAIVNVGSMSGLVINKGFAAAHYMVSKAGTHQVTKALAVEWAPLGVRVNAVAPGYTVTSQTDLLRGSPEMNRTALDTTPMGRFADPSEIAAAVVFLASDAASYCAGTVLVVDGGHTCW